MTPAAARGGKSPGWAAFDREQRRKQALEPQKNDDPFPALTSTSTLPSRPCPPENNERVVQGQGRSFSSPVLAPRPKFPTLLLDAMAKLKELCSWADDSLIQDVMAAAEDDVDRASTLLQAMVPGENSEKRNTDVSTPTSTPPLLGIPDPESETTAHVAEPKPTDELEFDSRGKQLSEDIKGIMERFKSAPIEPEWEEEEEEEDIYLRHRKEALRTMRSASQHSKSARNAFVRGDHLSARQHSLKAQQHWLASQNLNAQAAKDILSIRNSQNDVWKLDLHGLHAAEAIQVLQQHLHRIEAQLLSPIPKMPFPTRIVRSSSPESFVSLEAQKLEKQQQHASSSFRRGPTSLQVITGVGNHSRGQASLPTAIRGFLNENGYHFEEFNPGVIIIEPKFRAVC